MTDSIPRLWNHWSLVSCHHCPVFTEPFCGDRVPVKCSPACVHNVYWHVPGSGDHWPLRELPRPRVPSVRTLWGSREHGTLSRHRLPPGISSAISRLSLRPPRSRAVNEDLFMFRMDSSRNGPKNSDGNFIVVWDNINNPDSLLWPEMLHILYWRRNN